MISVWKPRQPQWQGWTKSSPGGNIISHGRRQAKVIPQLSKTSGITCQSTTRAKHAWGPLRNQELVPHTKPTVLALAHVLHCLFFNSEGKRVLSSQGMQYCPHKLHSLKEMRPPDVNKHKASYIRSSQPAGTTSPGIPGKRSLLSVCVCVKDVYA